MGTLQFVKTITRSPLSHNLVMGTVGLTILWMIASVVSILFQCPAPQTWTILSQRCFNQRAFWDASGSFDVTIDVKLALTPMYIVWHLQMPRKKKILTMGVFSTKLLTTPLTILRLRYIASTSLSLDQTYDDFNTITITEIGMNFSIITTCFPFLKTIIDNLQPGVLTSEVHTSSSHHSYTKRANHALRSLGKRSQKSDLQRLPSDSRQWLNEPGRYDTVTSAGSRVGTSRSSSHGSQTLIIKQKTDFEVRCEDGTFQERRGEESV